jgi:hypothetical protein
MPACTISAAARHGGVDRRTLQRAIRTGRLALTAAPRRDCRRGGLLADA